MHYGILCLSYVFVFTLFHCSGAIHPTVETGLTASNDLMDKFEYDDGYKIFITHGQYVINSTLTKNGHYREITVTLVAFNETFLLDMKLNTYLFAVDYTEKSVKRSGEVFRRVNHTESHCFYIGKVRNKVHSTAAVSTCNGIVGHFTIDNTSYEIEPEGNHLHGPHKVYRNRANAKSRFKCGTDDAVFSNFVNQEQSRKRVRRSFPWPQDQDRRDRIVELYVANGAGLGSMYDLRGYDGFQRTKDIVNIASSLYQSLGIYLVLVGMEVWTKNEMILVNYTDSIGTLYRWYQYRMNNILPNVRHDSAVLITSQSFVGGVIGRAVMGYMCSYKYSGAVVSDIYNSAGATGNTVAHEIGHTFGLAHDNTSCRCDDPSGSCIMSAYTNLGNPSSKWSQCSLETLERMLNEGIDLCLHNIPQTVFQPKSTCGNGIVEDGEQCDCGKAISQECNIDCCNSTTCQLVGKATCAYGRCCDLSKCEIRPRSVTCRPTAGDCDLSEECNGMEPTCPMDTYRQDGTSCTVNGESAYCYRGLCQSRESQCQLIWGSEAIESDAVCYTYFNVYGAYYGNCGVNITDGTFIPCQAEDVMCGRLLCSVNQSIHLNYYQNYYLKSEASLGNSLCYSVTFDYGLDTQDPGLVPNGAKCGEEKMCVNQTCVNINTVQVFCYDSCQKHEVCNNLGVCQRESSESVYVSSSSITAFPIQNTGSGNQSTVKAVNTTSTWSSSNAVSPTITSSVSTTTTPTTTASTLTTTTRSTIFSSSTTATSTYSSTTIPLISNVSKVSASLRRTPSVASTSATTRTSTLRILRKTPIPTKSTRRAAADGTSTSFIRRMTMVTTPSTVSPLGTEATFGAYLDANATGITSLLNLNGLLANRFNRFNLITDSFMPALALDQYFYIEICAGLLPSTTALVRTIGSYPQISLDWDSASHNGVDSECRAGVVLVTAGAYVSLSQNGRGIYSSDSLETSWSMFSITDTMRYSNQLLSLYGGRTWSEFGNIPLQNYVVYPLTSDRLLDASSAGYACSAKTETYFFSMSVGVAPGGTAAVQLKITGISYTFEMARSNSLTTGTTTLARIVLVPCSTEAQMVLVKGRVVPGVNLISLTAFPYELSIGSSISWAGYRTSNISGAETVKYDLWLSKTGISFTTENSVLQMHLSGYYYLYMSAGVFPGTSMKMVMLRNGETLFGLTRMSTDHDGIDTVGHGMVVLLQDGDQIRVEAETAAYSSTVGLHISFIGMLIYKA